MSHVVLPQRTFILGAVNDYMQQTVGPEDPVFIYFVFFGTRKTHSPVAILNGSKLPFCEVGDCNTESPSMQHQSGLGHNSFDGVVSYLKTNYMTIFAIGGVKKTM